MSKQKRQSQPKATGGKTKAETRYANAADATNKRVRKTGLAVPLDSPEGREMVDATVESSKEREKKKAKAKRNTK